MLTGTHLCRKDLRMSEPRKTPLSVPTQQTPADTRRRIISASVTLFVTALLSLFIPYATLVVGLCIAIIGGAALRWESVPVVRRMWGVYLVGGLLLAIYGLYLVRIYTKNF
jgi:hypothetical protein